MDYSLKKSKIRDKYCKKVFKEYGSIFYPSAISNKNNALYSKQLKLFNYLFSLGGDAQVFLWNEFGHFDDDLYKGIVPDDLSKEEYEFFEKYRNTIIELKKQYGKTDNRKININAPFETENLVLKPCDDISNKITVNYFKKNVKEFLDIYKNKRFKAFDIKENVDYTSQFKFAIFLKGTNEFVGIIELSDCTVDVKYRLEVFIFDKFRGKGYATEAIKTLLEKAKNKQLFFLDETLRVFVYKKTALDIKCIEVVVDENNAVANKMIEKCGFKLTGKNYYAHYYNGTHLNDNVYYYFL